MSGILFMVALSLAPYDLDWSAPEGCPDQAAIEARIDRLVPTTGRMDGAPPLEARAQVERRGSSNRRRGWRLRLFVGEASKPRIVSAPSCVELADVAALIVAIALDPEVLTREPPESQLVPVRLPVQTPSEVQSLPASEAPPEPTWEPTLRGDREPEPRSGGRRPASMPEESPPRSDPAPIAPTAATDRRPRRGPARLFGFGALDGGLMFNVVPDLTGAVGLRGGLGGRGWKVGAGLLYAAPQGRVAPADSGVSGRFQLVTGRVRGCGVPGTRHVDFPLCGELQFGAMIGRGAGSITARTAASPWVGLALGPSVLWRPNQARFGAFLGVDAVVALTRPAFETGPTGVVYRVPSAGFQVLAGFELRSK